jgi:SAM-dependent methyltransferase
VRSRKANGDNGLAAEVRAATGPRRSKIDDWTSGYVADIGYTYGYYPELNPLNTRLSFLYGGVAPPKVATACELGFGQGVSVNVHAAASPVHWWGTDFNPAQAGFAQSLAEASGARADLFDESFAEFCARDDMPQMDYVGLHGIWSWISDENRAVIVDFVRRKLKVGGVLYVSYNTQPGWAAMVPMRDLFVEHAAVMGSPGQGRVSRVDAALAFTEKLMAANPAFARANPSVNERLKKLMAHNRNYLAHEYFNRDWEPMSFARMAQWLGPAKLSFAGSAYCMDPVDAMNLTADQQALLAGIPDPSFRQTVRDFCMNQGFRKDYWVKGARQLTTPEQIDALRRLTVVLMAAKPDVTLKATGAQGEMNLNEEIYNPVLEMLGDHKPRTLAELEAGLKGSNVTFGQLIQAIMVLAGKGVVQSVQEAAAIDLSKVSSEKLNRALMTGAAFGKEVAYLSSPVTGGGVSMPRFHQLFAAAILEGKKKPEEWARDVWAILAAQSQQILKDGKALATPEENIAELTAQAKEFSTKRLPVLKALKIV